MYACMHVWREGDACSALMLIDASGVQQVMDRRVKASREEQLQKHAAALQAAMQAAGHASSAQDAGAVALQAAMTAAASVPKEGTQLKEMLKQQTSHSTLAHVLTHLWHTERLWRHALHQGLQLFQETHQVWSCC